tara:strand:+ start:20 stop:814 length:795 start_codon:yes stop_codon:yes gene_type:complete
MKTYNFCNNCGKQGHLYQHCKSPITSIGIIAFKKVENEHKYLMICRKDSLGYVDFMRGKYPLFNKEYLMNIINEMTIDEKKRILEVDFDILWKDLWGNLLGIQYRGEERTSREKYNSLKEGVMIKNKLCTLQSLIEESETSWETPEWGFPKGRRNYQEKDLTCALREFEEETGYNKNTINIISNIVPYEEIFTGSNFKSYKHKYFLGLADSSNISEDQFQRTEVSKLSWKTYEECLNCIRPYNLEKIEILHKVNNILKEYSLFL